jgi:hypothetical protein
MTGIDEDTPAPPPTIVGVVFLLLPLAKLLGLLPWTWGTVLVGLVCVSAVGGVRAFLKGLEREVAGVVLPPLKAIDACLATGSLGLLIAAAAGFVHWRLTVLVIVVMVLAMLGGVLRLFGPFLLRVPRAGRLGGFAKRFAGRAARAYRVGNLGFKSTRDWAFKERRGTFVELIPAYYAPFMSINISADSIVQTEENSLAGLQRYTEQYIQKQVSGQILRNDIRTLAGKQGIDCEYLFQGIRVRKAIVIHHGTEYVINMGVRDPQLSDAVEPVFDAFLRTLSLFTPDFPLQWALGGTVRVRIPAEYQRTSDSRDNTIWLWRKGKRTLTLALRHVPADPDAKFDGRMFHGIPDSLFKDESSLGGVEIEETGALVQSRSVSEWSDDGREQQECFGIRLPAGTHVLFSLRHEGREEATFAGGLPRETFARELVTTIEEVVPDGPEP